MKSQRTHTRTVFISDIHIPYEDKKSLVEDAINLDGRGHFISYYDGIEYEQYINDNFCILIYKIHYKKF